MSNSNGKRRPKVRLEGEDGNAWAIVARVCGALKEAGYSEEKIEQYTEEAMSGDYNHLLRITMEWVEAD